MHTTSFWLTVPEAVVEEFRLPRALVIDGLRGLGSALETVSTIAMMCDPRDIGQTLGDGQADEQGGGPARDPHSGHTGGFDPTVFLFDAIPGGVGLAERIYERAEALFERARALIESCRCNGGCPACVGPGSESGERKRLALELLSCLDLRLRTPIPALVGT